MELLRCNWCIGSDIESNYHDIEWGVPLHNDHKLFEFMLLDGFQAGLSWKTILNKRDNFRRAFDNFDAELISEYNSDKLNSLMLDSGIVRNKLKIESSVVNAKVFLRTKNEFSTFDEYIWQFTDGKTINNSWTEMHQVPTRSDESDAMSKDLRKRGFKFVGITICYAFMQAAGMVNDHLVHCFRHEEVIH